MTIARYREAWLWRFRFERGIEDPSAATREQSADEMRAILMDGGKPKES